MFNGMSDSDKKKVLIIFLYAFVGVLVYVVVKYVLYLAAPFVVALLIACAADAPVSWLNRKLKIKRAVAGIIVLTLVTVITAAVIIYVGYFAVNEFGMFARNYGTYLGMLNDEALKMCTCIDDGFGLEVGSSYRFINNNISQTFVDIINKGVSYVLGCSVGITKSLIMWFTAIFITLTAAVFIISDYGKICKSCREGTYSGGFNICFAKMIRFGVVFLKTQLIIMTITMLICTFGLILIKNPYAVLIGILIGLLDALPVFGTGTVLIPWTVICLIMGRYINAAILFSVYIICYMVREILEPKLMGSSLGIHPVIMLMAMYAGILLFGVAGLILGPAAYIVISEIMAYIKKVL